MANAEELAAECSLAGLASPEAELLYGRLTSVGGLRMGSGPGDIDLDSPAARELAELDLLFGHRVKSDLVRAVPHATAMQLLLSRRQREMVAAHEQLARGWSVLESLLRSSHVELAAGSKADASIEVVTDAARVNMLSVELYVSARQELCTTNTAHGEQPLNDHHAIMPPQAALDNGARYRGIYDSTYAASPAGGRLLERFRRAGEEVRIRPTLPAKTLLVDGSVALVALTETIMGGAAIVRSPQLLALLKEWFELVWNDPGTSGITNTTRNPLTRPQRHVLRLLGTGMTDDAIARASDMSVRTVRRHVGAILEALEIQTRFAAGVAAAKRGWI